ncbi:putative SKI-interacting protein, SKIP [Helianthus annuus]|uniref:SKI-interacting protein, SKIP n=1 Tax=Helianthus annuus TaxID=4232 RepID=A0A9K3IPV6_HELAN|nr:putative SKI-interacting protein, SKIP [Helianthus annuus]KAJ0559167.1 putative SKI-interacting protein, SKIP [Helianthus annuus]KAJ0572108.1 putative SKI-interacting protein, SKIP [Helianthus annuus]KAJ0736573.1 putative SKI-interacting protein, SKIP [Helianthus annuus]KAJ0739517.1 putative SKI-interacting protein, SKIP [Helianthus annuus]
MAALKEILPPAKSFCYDHSSNPWFTLYAAAQPRNLQTHSQDSKFLKYKPSAASFNSASKERIIRMLEMPVDPLDPPKFKHKRIPKPNGSPPVPLMHSPPQPLTVQDQKGCWKIPPCVSNWKNPKGYTIPLDKRLAADGRGLNNRPVKLFL